MLMAVMHYPVEIVQPRAFPYVNPSKRLSSVFDDSISQLKFGKFRKNAEVK